MTKPKRSDEKADALTPWTKMPRTARTPFQECWAPLQNLFPCREEGLVSPCNLYLKPCSVGVEPLTVHRWWSQGTWGWRSCPERTRSGRARRPVTTAGFTCKNQHKDQCRATKAAFRTSADLMCYSGYLLWLYIILLEEADKIQLQPSWMPTLTVFVPCFQHVLLLLYF